ncbi:MAG TPA: hypothetical protein PKD09_01960 [Aggregatilinea sp.]|jgi:hypothetical protein|uniref:hypothetical protein n=1 Tax=Aggregatilinea sp. TaxID=2806333 RepID=UPI002BA451E7|nr:hypothetical protein [Aggregatilinea sp.]HML20382.1 hypothetical protein [Aggregatilinea sp.]
MERHVEVSITVGALGVIITLMGLFPGIAGLEVTPGIGVLQVLVILLGFSLMCIAAYVFARQAFFAGLPTTLGQDIGVRLTLTGLLFAAAAGLADVLGFGSHMPTATTRPLLGTWQAIAFIGGFLIASSGIVLYTLMGPSRSDDDDSDDNNSPRPPDSLGR